MLYRLGKSTTEGHLGQKRDFGLFPIENGEAPNASEQGRDKMDGRHQGDDCAPNKCRGEGKSLVVEGAARKHFE